MEDKIGTDGFQEIAKFLENLSFKRTLFGVEKEDVYACMQDLNAMYQDYLADMKEKQAEVEKDYGKRIAECDRQIDELIQKTSEYKAQRDQNLEKAQSLQVELQNLQNQLKIQQIQLEDHQTKSGEYTEKSELLAKVMMEAQRTSDNHFEQAKRKAGIIITEAQEEAGRILTENSRKLQHQEEEARTALANLKGVKIQAVQNLKLILSDLNQISSEVTKLQDELTDSPKNCGIEPVEQQRN